MTFIVTNTVNMIETTIPLALQAKLAEELKQGETLLWSAMPNPKYYTNQAKQECSIGGIVFAMVLALLAWNARYLMETEAVLLVCLACLILSALGASIWLLVAPWRNYRRDLRTLYAITNRRAITFEGDFSETVRSFLPKHLWNVFRREHEDETGDLVIFTEVRGSGEDTVIEDMGFFRIAHAKQVETLLRKLAKGIPIKSIDEMKAPASHGAAIGIDTRISPELRRTIASELEPDELVRWSSIPEPLSSSEMARYHWLFGVIIACCCAVVIGFFNRYGREIDYGKAMTMLIPLGFAFVLVIAALILAPGSAYRHLLNIAYVITDRRAIIVQGKGSISIHSLSPFKLGNRKRRDHRNGPSDILVQHSVWHSIERESRYLELGFLRIRDVDQVESLLADLAEKSSHKQTASLQCPV